MVNILKIEENIRKLCQNIDKDFIYNLLLWYGLPKSTITLMKKWTGNLSKNDYQVISKKKVFFHELQKGEDPHLKIDALNNDKATHKHSPRFLIVTDYNTILGIDTRTAWTLDVNIIDLWKYYDFFLPLSWMEKAEYNRENPADVKAAYKLGKLYDSIREDNSIISSEEIHALNKFLSRILFCFFAEDTGIFPKDIFTSTLDSYTQNDGSDMSDFMDRLFQVLDCKKDNRWDIPQYLVSFPYVNGALFRESFMIPRFSHKSRKLLIEAWKLLNWADINPDIFGSMVQAVVHPGDRENLWMHYTSVPNILKVIKPLFLDDLYEEFENSKWNSSKLQVLLKKLWSIKIFDPACWSGNFLIISYKELRRLEILILQELYAWELISFPISHVQLDQFYGIEIDDFACEVAELSLYIANHQMNLEFKEVFHKWEAMLPLKSSGKIVHWNATRLDWEKVCSKEEDKEIYILWNPPFDWARKQEPQQKEDLKNIFKKNYWNLDYVSAWYYKWAQYIKWTSYKLTLVSTNSVCQWEQVSLLWPQIFDLWIEIPFAYSSFKWKNNAKNNAGVIVVIIWLCELGTTKVKRIFWEQSFNIVRNISPYLTEGSSLCIWKRKKTLSWLPQMCVWSMPNDNGNLILNRFERESLINENPILKPFVRKLIWAKEHLRWEERFCIWLEKEDLPKVLNINAIFKRIKNVEDFRFASKRNATKKLWLIPYSFGENRFQNSMGIIIPRHSSERRKYIPIWFFNEGEVVMDSALTIYTNEVYLFWIISSNIHMVWMKAVAWRIKTDFRYSNDVVYNTFPFPNISTQKKNLITEHVYNVLDERAKHPEKTLAELYDPDKMPEGLKQAHQFLDEVIERCYRATPFRNDEERLSYLFKMYEQMIANEGNK